MRNIFSFAWNFLFPPQKPVLSDLPESPAVPVYTHQEAAPEVDPAIFHRYVGAGWVSLLQIESDNKDIKLYDLVRALEQLARNGYIRAVYRLETPTGFEEFENLEDANKDSRFSLKALMRYYKFDQ